MSLSLIDIMPSIVKDIDYEYDAIKSNVYENVIMQVLGNYKPSENPCFEQVMGIPGAGKSTFIEMYKKNNTVLISFDAIMNLIPEYQNDNKKLGSVASFKKWEMPARVIGYEVLRRALERKSNICFEHSGLINSGLDLIKNVKKYNYKTQMYCLVCDTKVAYARTLEREKLTKRHTPKAMIEQRAEKLNVYLDKYKILADKMIVYDTTNNKLALKEEN